MTLVKDSQREVANPVDLKTVCLAAKLHVLFTKFQDISPSLSVHARKREIPVGKTNV